MNKWKVTFTLTALYAFTVFPAYSAAVDPGSERVYEPRIVGGVDAISQDWRFFTQITSRFSNRSFCGASYLGGGYVLTAAHCVDGDLPGDLAVKVGAHQYNGTDGLRANVSQIHIHPQYVRSTLSYDIAVLKLDNDVNAPAVDIATGSLHQYVIEGDDLRVAGVGRLSEGGISPTILQEVTVPLVSDHVCQQSGGSYQNVGIDNFCAGYPQGQKDSCQGDSGGPIIVKHNNQIIQLGIVSWGIGCARPGQYGVYTDIAALREWVDSVIGGQVDTPSLAYDAITNLADFTVGERVSHAFTFKNTGLAQANITRVNILEAGVAEQAVIVSDTCSSASLNQHQSCSVLVEFGAGTPGNAKVTLSLIAHHSQSAIEAVVQASVLSADGSQNGGSYDYAYPEGLGQYGAGTIVLGTDGMRYQCRPYPNSNWCNSGGPYAPGTGWAAGDAWNAL
ncbi:trypsin-like serine protease [Photobacterium sp. WH24]|uniref:Trypsin-like serine protease n=1 Tax=Photobacterium arenosum TaxID=2774143 RepID=A0ABR9BFI1_9GAMM|nr:MULTISPECIES: trypsin-like serine protease [Photobacterium]MBD8511321.1 trypsin-like serine protease [Photobacterium arenosum]MBV7262976.1 trypsin-like serine protease [Photobacterium sp. WH24]